MVVSQGSRVFVDPDPFSEAIAGSSANNYWLKGLRYKLNVKAFGDIRTVELYTSGQIGDETNKFTFVNAGSGLYTYEETAGEDATALAIATTTDADANWADGVGFFFRIKVVGQNGGDRIIERRFWVRDPVDAILIDTEQLPYISPYPVLIGFQAFPVTIGSNVKNAAGVTNRGGIATVQVFTDPAALSPGSHVNAVAETPVANLASLSVPDRLTLGVIPGFVPPTGWPNFSMFYHYLTFRLRAKANSAYYRDVNVLLFASRKCKGPPFTYGFDSTGNVLPFPPVGYFAAVTVASEVSGDRRIKSIIHSGSSWGSEEFTDVGITNTSIFGEEQALVGVDVSNSAWVCFGSRHGLGDIGSSVWIHHYSSGSWDDGRLLSEFGKSTSSLQEISVRHIMAVGESSGHVMVVWDYFAATLSPTVITADDGEFVFWDGDAWSFPGPAARIGKLWQAIAMNNSDHAIVTRDFKTGAPGEEVDNAQVRHYRNGLWGSIITLWTSEEGGRVYAPRIAINDDNLAIQFFPVDLTGVPASGNIIKASFFNGTSWGALSTVYTGNFEEEPEEGYVSGIALNSQGMGVLVFFDFDEEEIFAIIWNGSSFGAAVQISAAGSGNVAEHPIVAMNNNGEIVIAYVQSASSSPTRRDVYIANFDGSWVITRISTDDTVWNNFGSVDINDGGYMSVTFQSEIDGTIYASDNLGGGFSTPVAIADFDNQSPPSGLPYRYHPRMRMLQ